MLPISIPDHYFRIACLDGLVKVLATLLNTPDDWPIVDDMKGDGDGWAAAPNGGAVWGKNGAAGLLLIAGDFHSASLDSCSLLMQHRAAWTNNGDTWALPGGARDSHETAAESALRESFEETGISAEQVEVLEAIVTAGPFEADPKRPKLAGQWTYTTVIARTVSGEALDTTANEESLELKWVRLNEVESFNLMPAFAAAWPGLKEKLKELAAEN